MPLGRPASARAAMVEQGYRVKRQVCSNCRFYQTHREPAEWALKLYPGDVARQQANLVDRGKRCGLGNFSVKASATCNKWEKQDAVRPGS